ncbi:MAG: radical SAM protein [Deltaproteobacteria bacterium]|nr:radical SAM protein [Deltaproteobacteria bacterium]
MRYVEPLYRPPSEAWSLIFQVTLGCSNLKTRRDPSSPTGWRVRGGCAFCVAYQTKPFRVRPEAEVLAEIDAAGAEVGGRVDRVFLADGDALVLSVDRLRRILERLYQRLPRLQRVTCYASPQNLMARSVGELRRLREAGLTMLYVGLESGDDEVLARIDKGATAEQMIEGGRRAKEAGLAQSLTVILGLAGPDASDRHAEATARVLDAIAPEYASALTLMVEERVPSFAEALADPSWRLLTPAESLRECRRMLAAMDADDVEFRSNHASNWLALKGRLARDKPRLLAEIDTALRDPRLLRPEFLRGL